MKTVSVKKISAGTIYKLIATGLLIGFLPLFVVFSVLGSFGMDVLKINGESVIGIKALFIGPLMSILLSLLFTVIIGSVTVLGLWIFSFFKPLNIKFTLSD